MRRIAVVLLMVLTAVIVMSGCSGIGSKGALSVGPRAESGGTEVSRPARSVRLTKNGIELQGETGDAGIVYSEETAPDGTKKRTVNTTSTAAAATKASRGWVVGVLAELSWWGWVALVIAVVAAVTIVPGAGATLLGKLGEALNLFYRSSTVQGIVVGQQASRTAVAAINPAALKAGDAAAIDAMPDASAAAVAAIKTDLKASGEIESARGIG